MEDGGSAAGMGGARRRAPGQVAPGTALEFQTWRKSLYGFTQLLFLSINYETIDSF